MELGEKTQAHGPMDSNSAPLAPSAIETGRAAERRQQISQLLTASRAAVDRALSNNSDTFLRQVKQQGGQ